MTTTLIVYFLLLIAAAGYVLAKRRASTHTLKQVHGDELHSLPRYYGYYAALWAGVPALLILMVWVSVDGSVIDWALLRQMPVDLNGQNASLVLNDIKLAASQYSEGQIEQSLAPLVEYLRGAREQSQTLKMTLVIAVAVMGALFGVTRVSAGFRARVHVESWVKYALLVCSSIAIITTVGIVASVLFESLVFFQSVSPLEFLFGTHWSPTAAEPKFGALPLFVGTLLISFIALVIAVPIGLMAAIYLSEYASSKARAISKPILELLAGVPTVVYGFFAVLTIAPLFRRFGERIGLDVASESALVAGVVMGVMVIPFISSLSDDAIKAVPQYLRDGSLGLGATQSETIKLVVLPAALPGIVGGVLLAASRAIGETMIVVMAAGMAANMTANPLQAVTTVTVQIVTLLTGDQEFDSPKTLAAFALALLLFFVTLVLNLAALRLVKKYREQYD